MAESFTELFIEGPDDTVRGFVAGHVGGAGIEAPILVNKDHGIAHDALARQVAELIHLVENVVHVLIADRALDALTAAIEAAGDSLGLRVRGRRAVAGAHVETSWEVYTRGDAARIRRLYEQDLPAGIDLEGYEPKVEAHGETHETGMYAPAHAYTARAECTARGAPDALVRWTTRLREESFIHVHMIELDYADGESS